VAVAQDILVLLGRLTTAVTNIEALIAGGIPAADAALIHAALQVEVERLEALVPPVPTA